MEKFSVYVLEPKSPTEINLKEISETQSALLSLLKTAAERLVISGGEENLSVVRIIDELFPETHRGFIC